MKLIGNTLNHFFVIRLFIHLSIVHSFVHLFVCLFILYLDICLQAWTDGHNLLSHTLLPNSKRIILPGSDYLTLYLSPQHVASAILSAVDKWRKDYKVSA